MAESLKGRSVLETLVDEGSNAIDGVQLDLRPEVVASWRRSAMNGLHPERLSPEFDNEIDVDTRFRRSAEPVLAGLVAKLGNTPATVLLGDRNARVMGRWDTDRDLGRQLNSHQIFERIRCDEEQIGTNGIGTAAEEARPFLVAGREHFVEELTVYTCAGVPVRHPITGRLEGVVDLTVLHKDTNELMLPLMHQAAREIANRLYEDSTVAERLLLESFLKVVRRTSQPVVSMNAQLLISNASAARVLEGIDHAVLWEHVSQSVRDQSKLEGLVFEARQLETTRCTPVTDGDRLVGAVIEFKSQAARGASARGQKRRKHDLPGLAGRSTAWSHFVGELLRLCGAGARVVVAGEPGVGKVAALQAALAATGREAAAMVDCGEALASEPAAWSAEVERTLAADPSHVLFRHLEVLTEEAVALITPTVLEYLTSGGGLSGTIRTRGGDDSPGSASFIDRFECTRVGLKPLRLRPDDIGPVAAALLHEIVEAGDLRLSSEVVQVMMRLPWPTNIRQLRSVLRALAAERTVGEIVLSDLPTELRKQATRRPLTALERAECDAIIDAIDLCGGNKFHAAKKLGISRSRLYRKMAAYGIDLERSFF